MAVPNIFANQPGPIPLSQLDANFAAFQAPSGASLVGTPDGSTLAALLTSGIGHVVDSVAAMAALNPAQYTRAFATGYYAAADGGGGPYTWVAGATPNGVTLIASTFAGAPAGAWKLQHNGTISIKQIGAKGGGNDDSAVVTAAFNWCKTSGVNLSFPQDTYGVALDVSGSYLQFDVYGNGSTLVPVNISQSATVTCDNSGLAGGYGFIPARFYQFTITGRLNGSVTTGDVNYAVYMKCAAAKWYDCVFQYGKVHSVYGYYSQYGEYYSCTFASTTAAASSAGCFLTGNTASASSNENIFVRPKFFSNNNGLWIQGGIKNRIYSPTIQNTQAAGTGGIVLDQDPSGLFNEGTTIHLPYCEVNLVDHIKELGAANLTIDGAEFLGGTVSTTHAYNLRIINSTQYAPCAVTINHPNANTDSASVTLKGNNFTPTFNLTHPGPTVIDSDNAATALARKDGLLTDCAKVDQDSVPIVAMNDWAGAVPAIPRSVATNLFYLVLNAYAVPAYRVSIFTLELFTWDDTNNINNFGYSAHAQRYTVLITTNSSGAPQVYITPESSGTDIGISTGFEAPGNIAITASVSGNIVTFQANWPGAGSNASGMTLQTIAYVLRGAGTNGWYLVRT